MEYTPLLLRKDIEFLCVCIICCVWTPLFDFQAFLYIKCWTDLVVNSTAWFSPSLCVHCNFEWFGYELWGGMGINNYKKDYELSNTLRSLLAGDFNLYSQRNETYMRIMYTYVKSSQHWCVFKCMINGCKLLPVWRYFNWGSLQTLHHYTRIIQWSFVLNLETGLPTFHFRLHNELLNNPFWIKWITGPSFSSCWK